MRAIMLAILKRCFLKHCFLKHCFLAVAIAAASSACAEEDNRMQFLGFTALVAQPDVVWEEWDVAIFGALEERGFEVAYGRPLDDAKALLGYDLVALNIRRGLAPEEASALESYVAQGGAVYGSWGGPMGASDFLRQVCKVGATRSIRTDRLTLLEGPLAQGLPDAQIALAQHVGHMSMPSEGWEVVSVTPTSDGLPVAHDPAGNLLGVLSRHGQGRTAVLGFGPEQEKYFANTELGPVILDNLLEWLLADRITKGPQRWPNRVSVALPARAEITRVEVGGQPISDYAARRAGSLRTVQLPVDGVEKGQELDIRITYRPLPAERHVETMIHLPWNTLRAAADSPARLADYLSSLGATICQPLLRGSNGQAWYRGMPEDKPDDRLVTHYEGNFLTDLISECRQRDMRVIGGLYFDNATPVRRHPEVQQLDLDGAPKSNEYGNPYACFNNPLGQEYNLATVEQLLANYDLDGIILDDNYELDWYHNDCRCRYCESAFRSYCEAQGIPYPGPRDWSSKRSPRHDYRQLATRNLVANVARIVRSHGRRAGGWVSVTMDAAHLAESFDFLGGMAYTSPPRSARALLPALGECDLICLLWAPDASPAGMEREAREAIHAGCAAIGFWIRGDDGGYELDPERTEAIRRAFASAEREWLSFYRDELLSGDGRFAVVGGKVGRDELRLRIRNTGARVNRRVQGEVSLDLGALLLPAPPPPAAGRP